MPGEEIYRCIEASCGRSMPRRVNYCPYCGAAQAEATAHPTNVVASVRQRLPAQAEATAHPTNVVPAQAGTQVNPPAPSSHEWGTSARPSPAAATPPATPARPPQREPVRLRWWLLALALLWAVWYTAKPTAKKIDARIDRAISLATECKSREAQSELIALRREKADAAQLQRVQDALNAAAAECRRQRKRSRAWSDAGASAGAPAGAADGVERPRAPGAREGTTRAHSRANGEP